MADGVLGRQVDVCDAMSTEEDPVLALGCERPDGDAFASDSRRTLPEAPLEADVVFGGWDGAHGLMRIVFYRRQAIRHGASARPIPARRHVLGERLMRALEIVDCAPDIECALHLAEIAEPLEC